MSRDHRKLRVFTLADELAMDRCARRTPAEYRNFLNVAAASSAETSYLVDLAGRLDLLPAEHAQRLGTGYSELTASLKTLVRVLEERGD